MLKYNEFKANRDIISSNMKFFYIMAIILFFPPFISAGTFDKGKEAFLNNNPAEAVLYLEQALSEEPGNENVYMYLGLSYIQNGLIEKAITVFLNGADQAGIQEGRFYLNAGNAYYSKEKLDEALKLYNLIISEGFREKGQALLNKANIYMTKKNFPEAVSLYKEYLLEEPLSDQKEKILRLITLIEAKIEAEALEAERLAAEAERLRLSEEQRKASEAAEAERLRLAEEKRKAEEAARQQALMDEILNSLSTIGEDTQNIAADSETIKQTDEASDIDD
ncbi:MAG: tetratricopeptide repeat protein [Spirochaetaceae bacterium]|nr:tetratricopeptide repeat protein [Spirochaetaceae bacterium]